MNHNFHFHIMSSFIICCYLTEYMLYKYLNFAHNFNDLFSFKNINTLCLNIISDYFRFLLCFGQNILFITDDVYNISVSEHRILTSWNEFLKCLMTWYFVHCLTGPLNSIRCFNWGLNSWDDWGSGKLSAYVLDTVFICVQILV